MRCASIVVLYFAAAASAQERFVERAPRLREPLAHTQERAGNPQRIAPWAVPSTTRFDTGGYVGGTFGTDFTGLRRRAGRIFRTPSPYPAAGPSIARAYRSDGPRLPDVFSARPLRKAILAKKEALAAP